MSTNGERNVNDDANVDEGIETIRKSLRDVISELKQSEVVPFEAMAVVEDVFLAVFSLVDRQHEMIREYKANQDNLLAYTHWLVGERPPIAVLCGSTRFADVFNEEAERLTLEGYMVLRPEVVTYLQDNDPQLHDPETKAMLDELHLKKIDMCKRTDDVVHVINVAGYVGESTSREILHAKIRGIQITWYEQSMVPSMPSVKDE